MKLQTEFKYKARGTGATTWMLEHLLDSVKKGEPSCVVVCSSSLDAERIKSDFLRMLSKENLQYNFKPNNLFSIIVGHSEVLFRSFRELSNSLCGFYISGLYIDHYTEELFGPNSSASEEEKLAFNALVFQFFMEDEKFREEDYIWEKRLKNKKITKKL